MGARESVENRYEGSLEANNCTEVENDARLNRELMARFQA